MIILARVIISTFVYTCFLTASPVYSEPNLGLHNDAKYFIENQLNRKHWYGV